MKPFATRRPFVKSRLLILLALFLSSFQSVKEQGAKSASETVIKVVDEKAIPVLEKALTRTEDALSSRVLSSTLTGGKKSVVRAFETVHPRVRWHRFAPKDVKQFVTSFEEGFRTPNATLKIPAPISC